MSFLLLNSLSDFNGVLMLCSTCSISSFCLLLFGLPRKSSSCSSFSMTIFPFSFVLLRFFVDEEFAFSITLFGIGLFKFWSSSSSSFREDADFVDERVSRDSFNGLSDIFMIFDLFSLIIFGELNVGCVVISLFFSSFPKFCCNFWNLSSYAFNNSFACLSWVESWSFSCLSLFFFWMFFTKFRERNFRGEKQQKQRNYEVWMVYFTFSLESFCIWLFRSKISLLWASSSFVNNSLKLIFFCFPHNTFALNAFLCQQWDASLLKILQGKKNLSFIICLFWWYWIGLCFKFYFFFDISIISIGKKNKKLFVLLLSFHRLWIVCFVVITFLLFIRTHFSISKNFFFFWQNTSTPKPTMSASSSDMPLDQWIATVKECKYLPENDLKKLCDRVSLILYQKTEEIGFVLFFFFFQ